MSQAEPKQRRLPVYVKTVYEWIRRVPSGTVATYGQIGELAGIGPRQVAHSLRMMPSGWNCPWYRVINSQGRISDHSSGQEQMDLLEEEGILFEKGRVDLEVFQWVP